MQQSTSQIDPIKELRLRCWARRNWVPASRRGRSWHPVVLDEMHRRDSELTAPIVYETETVARYVPLHPGEFHRLDAAHEGVAPPNLAGERAPAPHEFCEYYVW